MNAEVTAGSDVVLDVRVCLSLEVGRKQMTIRDVLALGPGSVVDLEKPAGDPLDIVVNDRLVAHGEVVMVNDRYGVRFGEAIGASEKRR